MRQPRPSMSTLAVSLVAMAFCLTFVRKVEAGPIIQDVSNEARNISPWVGQSFTAEDVFIDLVGVYVVDFTFMSVATDPSVEYSLYEGIGTGGTLPGSRVFSGLSEGFSSFADVSFAGIPLMVGASYTLIVSNDTGDWGVESAFGDFYAGGAALLPGGPDGFERELRFHVLPAASVPEPSTLVLIASGLMIAGARRRLGRRRDN